MFELNLASLPNSILYLEGVQLSYIKVYVHIFNLWHSDKLCFVSNAEFCRRTGLDRATVIRAINFFEEKGVLIRKMKGTKRYLMQPIKAIETETEFVDNLKQNCSNDAQGSQLGDGGVAQLRREGSQLGDHNNKLNTKLNKSFYKNQNEQKPDWAAMKNESAAIREHQERKRKEMEAPRSSDKPRCRWTFKQAKDYCRQIALNQPIQNSVTAGSISESSVQKDTLHGIDNSSPALAT